MKIPILRKGTVFCLTRPWIQLQLFWDMMAHVNITIGRLIHVDLSICNHSGDWDLSLCYKVKVSTRIYLHNIYQYIAYLPNNIYYGGVNTVTLKDIPGNQLTTLKGWYFA